MSGKIEKLIKPGSSYEHVARWLTFCGAQPPFCNVSEKLPSQAQNDNSQLGVSVLAKIINSSFFHKGFGVGGFLACFYRKVLCISRTRR